uniref:Ribosomal protein S8 n=1 Tax=Proschkinia sp. SZCZR1824 TaxID=2588390 RepID=A0A4Y5SFX3_9STRA|nr:ribosomal protein S8 [Proschkinia sp. SZCZR1824]
MKTYLYSMFDRIKKSQRANQSFVYIMRKNICESFLLILWDEGFILGYSIISKNNLKVFLKYKSGKPLINSIKTISKPSRRIYYSIKQIWKINSSKSFLIFSTNKGLQSINSCKRLKLGGEPYIIVR